MTPERSFFLISITIATVLGSLIAYGTLLADLVFSPQNLKTESVSRYEARFATLRQLLPPHGVVGYLSDCPESDGNYIARLYVTQYALAPVVVVPSPEYTFVVGNFCKDSPDPGIYTKSGMTLLKNAGNGVMLFSRDLK